MQLLAPKKLTTLVFKANDGTVDSSDTYTVTLTATGAGGGGGGGGGGGDSSTSTSTPATPTYKANISGIGTTGITLPVIVNANTGSATTELGTTLVKIFLPARERRSSRYPPFPA